LEPRQTFINGADLKDDLKRLDEYYSALPEDVQRQGLTGFAKFPPEDTTFLTTQLWDRYLPRWRSMGPSADLSPELRQSLLEQLKELTESEKLRPHNERDIDKLGYVTVQRRVYTRKGKWRRFSEEIEQRGCDEEQNG